MVSNTSWGYDARVETRYDPHGNEVERLQPWMWPKTDVALWEGPMREWINDHSKNWFQNVKNFEVVVQAGGACGMYPRLLADHFERVYTIEPMSINFHCLVNNCQNSRIVKIMAALGDKPGMCNIYEGDDGNMGCHQMNNYNDGSIVDGWVPIITIDSLGLKACDLIALDVELYEPQVLLGAVETIHKFHPVITTELGNRPKIIEFMEKWGYTVQIVSAMDTVWMPKS